MGFEKKSSELRDVELQPEEKIVEYYNILVAWERAYLKEKAQMHRDTRLFHLFHLLLYLLQYHSDSPHMGLHFMMILKFVKSFVNKIIKKPFSKTDSVEKMVLNLNSNGRGERGSLFSMSALAFALNGDSGFC